MSTSTLSRCQSVGPEPPDPGRAACRRPGPRAGTSRRALATSARRSPSPSASIFSMSAAVELLAGRDDDLALAGSGPGPARRPRPLPSRAWSVRSWLNDELGTTSGLMSSAASIRSASLRPPAIRPGEPGPRLGHLACRAARSRSVRVEDARRLGPDLGPASRRRVRAACLRRVGRERRDRGRQQRRRARRASGSP